MRRVKGLGSARYKTRKDIERELHSVGVDPDEVKISKEFGLYRWWGVFDASDPRLNALVRIIQPYYPEPFVIERIEYSDEDIAAAELLCLDFNSNVVNRGNAGGRFGTEYDYSQGCPVCYSGAKLISPFRISKRDLPKKRMVATPFNDTFLVQSDLLDRLRALPGSEEWLVPVEDRRTHEALPWMAIMPQMVLPPFHPTTRGVEKYPEAGCLKCQRDNYSQHGIDNKDAFEPVYSRSAIEQACASWYRGERRIPQVAGSWEILGPGVGPDQLPCNPRVAPVVSYPMIMVDQEVAQIFKSTVPRYITLTPVPLVDDE